MTFSSVVSYHTNTTGCGVANFSKQLADRLGVPFVGLDGFWGAHPLLSLKWSEQPPVLELLPVYDKFSVFWHDAGTDLISTRAAIVYYADPSLGPNGLWCPSLLTPSKPRTVRLFSFGMAHKLQTAHYAKVRQLLEAAGLDYRLRVSVGLHEGTSLSDATRHFDALNDIMGADKVTILGCLSDDAVAEELDGAHYVLAFFADGVKTNNTTVHAALDAGARVITNGALRSAIDVKQLDAWPVPYNPYSWDHLLAEMESICAATTPRQHARL